MRFRFRGRDGGFQLSKGGRDLSAADDEGSYVDAGSVGGGPGECGADEGGVAEYGWGEGVFFLVG